jgi:hypothetical protein
MTRTLTEQRIRRAYHAEPARKTEAELQALAADLDKTHPRCRRVATEDQDYPAPGHAAHPGQ